VCVCVCVWVQDGQFLVASGIFLACAFHENIPEQQTRVAGVLRFFPAMPVSSRSASSANSKSSPLDPSPPCPSLLDKPGPWLCFLNLLCVCSVGVCVSLVSEETHHRAATAAEAYPSPPRLFGSFSPSFELSPISRALYVTPSRVRTCLCSDLVPRAFTSKPAERSSPEPSSSAARPV
jgi:hypothetical protein